MAGWLEGKTALVVGGGSGIGLAVVEAYAREGADVAVLERDEEKCSRLATRPALEVVQGDAASADANAEAVRRTLERFGQLDVLVSCVGVFDHYTPLRDLSGPQLDAAFDEIFAVNVKSVLLSAQAALPALTERRGSIVLTLSSSSFFAGRGGILYVASKFALRGVVTELASELAPAVRVNGVAPGGTVKTDLRGLGALGREDDRIDDRPGRPEAMEARTPLSVALTPEDHAAAYVMLASAGARGITGEVIRSDGGLSVR